MTQPVKSAATDAGFAMAFHPSVMAASLALNLLGAALPIFTLQVYDRVIPNAATDTLTLLFALLLAVLVGEGLLRAARGRLAAWTGARYEHETAVRVVERLLDAEQSALRAESPGKQLERLAAIDRLREFYANQGANIAIDLPFTAVFAVLIWLIAGELVWVALAAFACFGVLAIAIGGALHRALADRADSDDRRTSFMIEALSGITTIKALTMERQMMRRYERLMDGAATAAHRVAYASGLSQNLGGLFSNLTVAAMAGFGSLMVLDAELTVGQLAASTLLAGRLMQPLLRAMGIWTNFQSIRVAQKRLQELDDLPQEPAQAGAGAIVGEGAVRLENVRFAYPGAAQPILDGADLDIAPGECVAIVGANGGGRSTVLSLIAGALRPQAGRVVYDGRALGPKDPRPGPAEIAVLPRNGVVFHGTLIDNLTGFRKGPVVDRALDVAMRLGLDGFVAGLPDGYETEIRGGQTELLPGGVRQRVALVRALADDPRIVLFDEANNALDHDSNERLLALLREMKGRVTLILVSYQPSVLRLADRVFDLEGGKFAERAS
ncbi:MAG: ATP-binding cassette domain-containing protein [Azospirillum sp.]|nr:ATP-binding cassette domain-containing protein [Azospirillum sp.]MCZ8122734.1 ABC transporter transmembrane domain-containing protein [Magnetospirillum sp.]